MMKKKSRAIILGAFLMVTFFLLVVLLLFEWSPSDNSAATTYYLSPTEGNDNNSGNASAPWKTISKADSSINNGDTVILKDGIYQGTGQTYRKVSKPGTKWIAENRHKAIIDGGFAPSALNGQWSNIKTVADNICGINGEKRNSFKRLLSIGGDGITVDGLFLRNSCGGGFSIGKGIDDITIINSKVDWTFVAGLNIDAQPNAINNNINILNNEFTRISFNDRYASFVDGYCSANDPDRDYCVNVSWQLGGENLIIRNNLIAWGRGEISITGTKNVLFEENLVIGNKNNFYSGNAHDVVVRNNLFWSPDSQMNPNTHWEKKGSQDNDWHISSRNEGGEDDNPQNEIIKGLLNIEFYSNVIINSSFQLNGYHKDKHSDSENIYFGNNTLIAHPDTSDDVGKNLVFDIAYGSKSTADGDALITAIVENNIIDVNKEKASRFNISLSGNDKVTFRNNILPPDVDSKMKGPGDVYTYDNGLNNVLTPVDFPIPAVGADTVDVDGLRNAVDIDDYRLKNNSPAINAGTTSEAPNGLTIPVAVRAEDYFKNSRIGLPDIGAIEFGGVYQSTTPTPLQSATPIVTPSITNTPGSSSTQTPTPIQSVTPSPTSTPRVQNTPTPTQIMGSVCGRADSDRDGDFDISDFVEFAAAYQDGNRACDDRTVDYGVCGGRDVDRDGRLNIADFGGTNGFASRYYPKISCSLS